MDERRKKLARVLAEIDGVISEARSHVVELGHEEPDERVRPANVLVEIVELRESAEGKLRGE
jgi:hypothetical protein